MAMYEVNEAAEMISRAVDSEAQIIFGASIDPAMSGKVRVTVLAAGFGSRRGYRGRAERLRLRYGQARSGRARLDGRHRRARFPTLSRLGARTWRIARASCWTPLLPTGSGSRRSRLRSRVSFSRNLTRIESFRSSSEFSRAVPTSKLIERIEHDPVLPLEWGRNKAGMSASEMLSTRRSRSRKCIWLQARDDAVAHARRLLELNVHKQELNRLLEPFLWHTVIVTATQWENFFELRCAPNAQPEIRQAALGMRDAIATSQPGSVAYGRLAYAAAAPR